MLEFAGRHLGKAFVLLVVSALILIALRSTPHLHAAGPTSRIGEMTAFIVAITGLIGTVLGGIEKILGWLGWLPKPKPEQEPTTDRRGLRVGDRRREIVPDDD